ncbi:hypothetical protein E8E13_010663 [Curvularia kusanoi]|uniref:Uncharacterized protein n=1 Tax=Curvularia kusanoi TaxID=90978 RepID=A0A9P4TNR2_CURKU|nr:hypothetical protein E8E13_010663 [Curvularia kusanoi]
MENAKQVAQIEQVPAWASVDNVTESGSSVKFVSKRSMSKLREERSRKTLQSQSSLGDLESTIVEEPKNGTEAQALPRLPSESAGSESTESSERKPVLWESPMPRLNLFVILARYHMAPI